jgi:hypothetical protein
MPGSGIELQLKLDVNEGAAYGWLRLPRVDSEFT